MKTISNVIQFPAQRRQAQISSESHPGEILLNKMLATAALEEVEEVAPPAAKTRASKAKPIRVKATKADMSGLPNAPVTQGRMEVGTREIFDRVTVMSAGKSSKDLAKSVGELAIETFGGKVENVIFTPDDGDLDDAEILPKSIVRNGATIEVMSARSRWVFRIEAP